MTMFALLVHASACFNSDSCVYASESCFVKSFGIIWHSSDGIEVEKNNLCPVHTSTTC